MEKSINDGISKVNQLYGAGPKKSSFKGEDGEALEGKPSLFNRYTLFSNRGDIINPSEIPQGGSIAKQTANQVVGNTNPLDTGKKVVQNPDAGSIITYFKSTDFPVEYDYGDFLYGKYYGKIPNNHMITLRRYAGPVEDNIYSSELNNKLDIARIVTWMGEETGNNLKDILGMNFGLKWREEESEVQRTNSQRMNVPSPLDNDILSVFNASAEGQSPGQVAGAFDKENATGGEDYDAWEVEGFYQNRVFGPVDVVDRLQVRDRGLDFNHTITISAEFSLRGYGDISPREAMLDVISNILAFSYANAPFWGGAVRVREDLRFNKLMGDGGLLKKGDFLGYFKSLIGDLGDKFQSLFAGGFGDAAENILKTGAAMGANKLINKFEMRRQFQTVKALLSGEATGEWHLTVGNPLRPIAVIGNLICKDTILEFDNALGLEDFPESIKATFTLEPARPRDITDIESMFNAGRGRMYLPGEQANTILDASTIKRNYYLAGETDPDNSKNIANQTQKDQLDAAGIRFDGSSGDDRFAKWSNNPGKIANALAFHPVIARMTPKNSSGNGSGGAEQTT